MDDTTQVRAFGHEGFDVRVYLTKAVPGFFGGHVDVYEGDAHKCRIVLAGPLDHEGAIEALDVKGRDWIAGQDSGEPLSS